tara:strand:+ start:1435 stop:2556 length:1122 start_codon:yes stop_codon:yes gene_type:complete
MKFITSSTKLLKAIQPLVSVVGNNPALPIIENLLLEIRNNELKITATDLETTVINCIEIESKSEDSIAVNAKLLLDTLKSFPEQPLTFKKNDNNNTLDITSDQGNYTISYINCDEFPHSPVLDNSKSAYISSEVLLRGISNTLFATGNDELRPVLAGIYIEINKNEILFVGTDAHKLVKYKNEIKSEETVNFIIPKKPLQVVKSVLLENHEDIKINYNKTNLILSIKKIEIHCRLVDGSYPNYEAVIPKENPNHLQIDRITLLNSLKRISIFSNQSTRQTKLQINGKELKISGEDIDFSNKAIEELTCEYEGQDIEIGFNGKFLIEILNTLQSDKINMHFSSPSKAAIIEPSDKINNNESILMLVMPVMLNQN